MASRASVEGSGAPGAKMIWLCRIRPGLSATSDGIVCAGAGDAFASAGPCVFVLAAGASDAEAGFAFGTKEKGTEVVAKRSVADGEVALPSFATGGAGDLAACFAGGAGATAGAAAVTAGGA